MKHLSDKHTLYIHSFLVFFALKINIVQFVCNTKYFVKLIMYK